MFAVHMLPAAQGDCIWIEYGEERPTHRVLIDSGTPHTYDRLVERIADLPGNDRRFELFIVSHIDTDHIGAATQFLEERPKGVEFCDVWFNGYRHLRQVARPADKLGVPHAEELTAALETGRVPWNKAFGQGPAVVADNGALVAHELAGGLKVTLLSPYREQLLGLAPVWDEALRKLRAKEAHTEAALPDDHLGRKLDITALAERPFKEDKSEANGSSIAALVEYGEIRVILGADAFPSVIERSVDRLIQARGGSRLRVAAFKVCHHGSRYNTSTALAGKVAAKHYLISTDGTSTQHPNPEGIARLLHNSEDGATLVFNYKTRFNKDWDDAVLQKQPPRFSTKYPRDNAGGITVRLE